MLRSLFKNALSVLAEKGVGILITFITTPILLKELGVTTYGVWILLINMVAWSRMSNLGFGSAVTRSASLYIDRNKFLEINDLYNTSMFLNFILGLLGVVIVISPVFFPEILNLPDDYKDQSKLILFLLSIKVLFDFALMTANNYFLAALKQNIQSNISSICELIKGISTIYLVINGFGMIGMLFSLLISDFVGLIIKFYYLKKVYPDIRLNFLHIKIKHIKGIFSFSKYILLANVAQVIRSRIGVNVVSKIVGVTSVATFNIAQQLVLHCENIITIISHVVSPAASRVLNRDSNVGYSKYVSQISRLNLFSTFVVMLPLFILSDYFVLIWLGSEYYFVSELISIFAISLIGKFVFYSAQSVMIAKAKHKSLPIIHIIGAFLTVLLSVIFADNYGVIGVVFGLVISSLIVDFCFFSPVLIREIGSEKSKFLKIIFFVFIYSIVIVSSSNFFLELLEISGWLIFFTTTAVISCLNLICLWFIIFTKEEKCSHILILKKRKI